MKYKLWIKNTLLILFAVVLSISTGDAKYCKTSTHHDHDHSKNIRFVSNQGQWDTKVQYKASLGKLSTIYLEEKSFTYVFGDEKSFAKAHDYIHFPYQKEVKINMHAYKVEFLNAQNTTSKGLDIRPEKHNYFLGNNPEKWAANVPIYEGVLYPNLYPNIDLKAYEVDGFFKYDFIVKNKANPNQITLNYKGVDKLEIKNGDLIIYTSIGEIVEYKPYAYQLINGKRIEVDCEYQLSNNNLTFNFPNGYNQEEELIIDPTVVAATLSGSMDHDNFGHSATYDLSGNIYTGARNFGSGYPATTGAFDLTFNGSSTDIEETTDIAISKYNPDGSQLIYATYIGGSDAEQPHSLITDVDGQIYIYGTSDSPNYPTTNAAVQPNKSGNIDIVLTVLSADGSQLVGSTFLGGSEDDGQNINPYNTNYGDDFRGEIYLDNNRNVYITSNTRSSNFPTTANAFDNTFNSSGSNEQDAVVVKLNNSLSYLYWSTFLGGTGADTGMGIRVDNDNFVYVTGTAADANFPIPNANYNGGNTDAYIVKFSPDGSQIINGRFFGTNQDDDSYFIDLDTEKNIHIYGLTSGNIPSTTGTYRFQEYSKQFIVAFSPNLENIIYSTTLGRGPNSDNPSNFADSDFNPVAFMVDKCNNIYISGYAAISNLPTTNDAFYNDQEGTFYLAVLEPNATALSFATYYGLSNHVDGGTSRFDRSGVVYQAVCSCGENKMTTNPNAWATTQDPSTRNECDIGVFKIDFDVPSVTAFASVSPATSGCSPFRTYFTYTGKNATDFFWDFGNGETSTETNPAMTFEQAGSYDVTLIASNPFACNLADTFVIQIDVIDNTTTVLDSSICASAGSYLVDVTTVNAQYQWNDNYNSATRAINTSGTYWVDVTVGNCTRRDSFILNFQPEFNYTLDDILFCDAPLSPVDVTKDNIVSYLWDDGSTNPIRNITEAGTYSIEVINDLGCYGRDTFDVTFGTTPFTDLGSSDTLCRGDATTLRASNPLNLDVTYSWNTGGNSDSLLVTEGGTYYATLNNNGCTFTDSVYIHYSSFNIAYESDGISCFDLCDGAVTALPTGESPPFQLEWENGSTDADLDNLCQGIYQITITDNQNCEYLDSFTLAAPDSLYFTTSKQNVKCNGDANGIIQITNILGGTAPFQSSYDGGNTFLDASLQTNLNGGLYEIIIRDKNGCRATDSVFVYEPVAATIDAGLDQTIIMGESTQLEGQVLPYPIANSLITWLEADSLECPTCLESTVDPTRTTLYTLTATDTLSGCELTDDVLITVDVERNVYIPNVFSPNEDGNNDIFQVYTGVGVKEITKMTVYDRWGEVLWIGENISPKTPTGWDGSFKGQKMNPAVFVYVIEISFVDDEVKTYTGDVTLLK